MLCSLSSWTLVSQRTFSGYLCGALYSTKATDRDRSLTVAGGRFGRTLSDCAARRIERRAQDRRRGDHPTNRAVILGLSARLARGLRVLALRLLDEALGRVRA